MKNIVKAYCKDIFLSKKFITAFVCGILTVAFVIILDIKDQIQPSGLETIYFTNKLFLIYAPVFYGLLFLRSNAYLSLINMSVLRVKKEVNDKAVVVLEIGLTILLDTLFCLITPVLISPDELPAIILLYVYTLIFHLILSIIQSYFLLYTKYPYVGIIVGIILCAVFNYNFLRMILPQ